MGGRYGTKAEALQLWNLRPLYEMVAAMLDDPRFVEPPNCCEAHGPRITRLPMELFSFHDSSRIHSLNISLWRTPESSPSQFRGRFLSEIWTRRSPDTAFTPKIRTRHRKKGYFHFCAFFFFLLLEPLLRRSYNIAHK